MELAQNMGAVYGNEQVGSEYAVPVSLKPKLGQKGAEQIGKLKQYFKLSGVELDPEVQYILGTTFIYDVQKMYLSKPDVLTHFLQRYAKPRESNQVVSERFAYPMQSGKSVLVKLNDGQTTFNYDIPPDRVVEFAKGLTDLLVTKGFHAVK